MTMTDPIADLFTRLRNGGLAGHNKVDMPHSRIKESIARLLVKEGYLTDVQVSEVEGRKHIRAYVKRDLDGNTVFGTIQRVSKPGCRVYKRTRDIERVLRGMGIGIYSTSKGVLTDSDCREQRLGGEYLGRIW